MANRRGRSTSPQRPPQPSVYAEDDNFLNTRQIEAFGRTVQATASQLINANFAQNDGAGTQDPYHSALSTMHRSLRRPMVQRSVFSFAKANPRELIRSNFNTAEIEHRAIAYLPDELLKNVPVSRSAFSLLDGFKASLSDEETFAEKVASKRRKGRKLLEDSKGPPRLVALRREREKAEHRLEMMGVRKTMCASEIKEIDEKIANLNTMRKVILGRLEDLEGEEHELEGEVADLAERIEEVQEEVEDEAALAGKTPELGAEGRGNVTPTEEDEGEEDEEATPGFMSESIYQKLPTNLSTKSSPTTKPKRRRPPPRRISLPVLHEHTPPGTLLRSLQTHHDAITALDFDAPFGTMVTAALDDTVRVWDLNAGRCMGLLEGHLSSVRCLQVEDNIVATGSLDASVRLWDLGMADYTPPPPESSKSKARRKMDQEEDAASTATGEDLFTPTATSDDDEEDDDNLPQPAPTNAMADTPLFTLSAHVAEVTALHFRNNTLVSGSADKTLRQWDLEKGRCVQTLDVLWAAAQQQTSVNQPQGGEGEGGWWKPSAGRVANTGEADFVGALQVFDAALACGTADGMVRLWDLRSGVVHRSLVGHTGAITSLQFDDVFLVTASRDRSVRIWDLRTGTIHDAFAYDNPISAMNFDARRIVAAAGEDVVKVYDKTEGRHWDCGAGASIAGTEGAAAAAGEVEGGGGAGVSRPAIVDRVRIKDGYLVEGRRDGVVGVWSC